MPRIYTALSRMFVLNRQKRTLTMSLGNGSAAINTPFRGTDITVAIWVNTTAVLGASAIALAVTWRRLFALWREAGAMNMPRSLSTCLLRDGKLVFITRDSIFIFTSP